jgi:hypothetical protein
MKFSKILLTCFALGATALTAFSQPSVGTGGANQTYSSQTIALPYSTLAAGTTTNIGLGWSSSTTYTNTTILYTNNTGSGYGGYVTNTVITTNTTTVYPMMYVGLQKDLAVGRQFWSSGFGTDTVTFARSIDGTVSNEDTVNTFSISATASNTTQVNFSTNLPETWIGGYGWVTIVSDSWQATNSATLTNPVAGGIQYGIKRGAR